MSWPEGSLRPAWAGLGMTVSLSYREYQWEDFSLLCTGTQRHEKVRMNTREISRPAGAGLEMTVGSWEQGWRSGEPVRINIHNCKRKTGSPLLTPPSRNNAVIPIRRQAERDLSGDPLWIWKKLVIRIPLLREKESFMNYCPAHKLTFMADWDDRRDPFVPLMRDCGWRVFIRDSE